MKVELAHDFIAKKIYEEASHEDKNRARVTKLLHERYSHHATSQKHDLLLTRRELNYIMPYVKRMDLSPDEERYIQASKNAIKRTKVKSRIKDVLIAGLVCAVFFSSWGFWERSQRAMTSQELANAQDSIDVLVRAMKEVPADVYDGNKEQPGTPVHFFSTIHIKGMVKNEENLPIPNARIAVLGAELYSKEDGTFEGYLILSPKDLKEKIQLKASQTNYLSTSKEIDTDQNNINLDVVLRRN